MVSKTELIRTRSLRDQGIGGSDRAVMARRARERRINLQLIQSGDKLPGWISIPGIATPERIGQYLDGLSPDARQKAETLLAQQNPQGQDKH